jgi:hypothetical protein
VAEGAGPEAHGTARQAAIDNMKKAEVPLVVVPVSGQPIPIDVGGQTCDPLFPARYGLTMAVRPPGHCLWSISRLWGIL